MVYQHGPRWQTTAHSHICWLTPSGWVISADWVATTGAGPRAESAELGPEPATPIRVNTVLPKAPTAKSINNVCPPNLCEHGVRETYQHMASGACLSSRSRESAAMQDGPGTRRRGRYQFSHIGPRQPGIQVTLLCGQVVAASCGGCPPEE